MSRGKRSAAGEEPLTEATLRADSRAYVEAKVAYSYAMTGLWVVPPEEASAIPAHTAVVLGKLLDYQEAFKVMVTHDSLFLLRRLTLPEDLHTVERLCQRLLKKLDRLLLMEQEVRADRIVYSAYILACLRRSGRETVPDALTARSLR